MSVDRISMFPALQYSDRERSSFFLENHKREKKYFISGPWYKQGQTKETEYYFSTKKGHFMYLCAGAFWEEMSTQQQHLPSYLIPLCWRYTFTLFDTETTTQQIAVSALSQ